MPFVPKPGCDIAKPPNPSITSSYRASTVDGIDEDATSIFVAGKYAYLTLDGTNEQFAIVDVSDRSSPKLVSSLASSDLGGNDAHVVVDGEYAYVASDSADALTIIDVSDPAAPVQVGTLSTTQLVNALRVQVTGDYAYVVARGGVNGTLVIVDVTNRAAPSQAGYVEKFFDSDTFTNVMAAPLDLYVKGGYAYVPGPGERTFSVIDVSNPFSPFHVTWLDGAGWEPDDTGRPWHVHVSGEYAFVTVSGVTDGLAVVDVSDPTTPAFQVFFGPPELNNAETIHMCSGKYAYLTGGGGSIGSGSVVSIVDVKSPLTPKLVGTLEGVSPVTGAEDAFVAGGAVFLPSQGSYTLAVVE